MNKLYLFITCLFVWLDIGLALRCIECNVWKAGYGHLCDNPLIRDDCLVCMKTETTVFMGYYKNTPRSSTIISRVCVKSKIPEFGNECHFYDMVAGISVECYCNEDECNGSGKTQYNLATMATALTFGVLSMRRLLS